jgi:hypothetical protein
VLVEIFGPVDGGAVVGVVVARVPAVLLVVGGLAAVDDLGLELPQAAMASAVSGTMNSASGFFTGFS